MTNPVLALLAEARLHAAPLFARWCARDGAMFCPASPAAIARFLREHASLGVKQLWPALQDISRLHTSMGLADPTLAGPVAAVLHDITDVAPPRTWPATWKERFKTLPYDLQTFIADHEAARDKALRRAQNDAAAARQKLAEHQQTSIETEGKRRMKAARNAPTLEERIQDLRTEIEAVVEARVDAVAESSPGVPQGVIRNLLTARAPACACAQYLELGRQK
jgi:hypothetical protein